MVEILLNKYLELISGNISDIDSEKEIVIYVTDGEYHHQRILTLVNYGNHIRVKEHYESYLGEVEVDKEIFGVKPSEVLRLYFPHLFK